MDISFTGFLFALLRMSESRGILILLFGVAIGVGIWTLLGKKSKPKRKTRPAPKPQEKGPDKIYDSEPIKSEYPRAPLPPPGLYTTPHYRGPMGVPVPVNSIKDPGLVGPGFVSSVDLDAPLREVTTSWVKVGLLISDHPEPKILNLWARPIAPAQDIYQYQVQDKDGFIIPLEKTGYLEEDDLVKHIPGKPGVWKVDLFQTSKYVWM